MGEREAGIGRAAGRRGDARHHLDPHAFGHQHIELFAAAAEHERIAALEAHDVAAGFRFRHQQRVDLSLRQRVVALALADEHAAGIAPRIFQHRRIDQLVIDDDVGLAQRTGRAQGQQLRIAGACAHQRHAAGLGLRLAAIDGTDEVARRALLVARQNGGGDGSAQHLVPETAARGILADARLDGGAEALRELRQAAEAGRQHALDRRAHALRQHRRCAVRGNRNHDVAAIDDRRHGEVAELRPVDNVHQLAGYVRMLRDSPIVGFVASRAEHQFGRREMLRRERVTNEIGMRVGDSGEQVGGWRLSDDGDARSGRAEQAQLGRRGAARADQQDRPALELQEQWKAAHLIHTQIRGKTPSVRLFRLVRSDIPLSQFYFTV